MKALYISIILLFFAAFPAQAQEAGPQEENTFPEISTATLKIRLDTTRNFVLVDVRTEEEYIEGHIPRAINVPPDKLERIADYLPPDKDMPIVFYCRGYV